MPLLVAAAIDQTGLVIHLLTAGLIAIAVSLALLTVWYWRYTKPIEAATAPLELIPLDARPPSEPAGGEVDSALDPTLDILGVVEPTEVDQDDVTVDWDAPAVAAHEDAQEDPVVPAQEITGEVPADGEGGQDDGDHETGRFGLDDDQWEVLTQAVLDTYLEPRVKTDH